jgi:hypothetical protein
MEQDRGVTRRPPPSRSRPKPLHIRKQLSQPHIARSRKQLDQDQTYQEHFENSVYPPLPSSAGSHGQSFESDRSRTSRSETTSRVNESAQSSLSSHKGRYRSATSIELPFTSNSTTRSTVSSYQQGYISDASPEIMGDFVPINPLDMANRPATADGGKPVFHR